MVDIKSGQKLEVVIDRMTPRDYEAITSEQFSFDWEQEKEYLVFKMTLLSDDEILGLSSLQFFDKEQRIEVRLIAAAKEHVGNNKLYDRIVGNLIAFAGKIALTKYGLDAMVSLIPKTLLIKHYIDKYGFTTAGNRLFLAEENLILLIKKYDNG